MIKKLVSHLGEYKAASIKTPLFAALEAIMDVLLPTIMAFIIDQGIEKGDMNAIIRYGLLTFLVAAIALVLGVLAGKYAAEASTGFAGNLRDAMYENIADAFLFSFCHSCICYFLCVFTYLFLFCLIDSKNNATCSQ